MKKYQLTTWARGGSEKITEYNISEADLPRFLREVENLKEIWNIDYHLEQI